MHALPPTCHPPTAYLHLYLNHAPVQAWVRDRVTKAATDAILRLQFPADCATARLLTCQLNKVCGFGCQIHHVAHCLANAVALNRTMVLNVSGPTPCTFVGGCLGGGQGGITVEACGERGARLIAVGPGVESTTGQ